MSKGFSTSSLTRGLLVDIDIYRIKHPSYLSRSVTTCSDSSNKPINELSNSISRQGLLHPIVVRAKAGTDYFEIVAGNRRYEACKALGWRKIVCHVLELDDKEAYEVTLIENLQRENLNPIEEAHSFKVYVEEYGWGGISDLASRLGKSVSYVDKRLRLLNSSPELIKSVYDRSINPSIAEELSPINDEKVLHGFVTMISKSRLSSRNVRKLVKEYREEPSSGIYNYNYVEDKIIDIDRKV
ncbi:MAG TPA: ParB/RepB/Spo0J family partition protein, partial [Nitrososphaeraceae archaeon]